MARVKSGEGVEVGDAWVVACGWEVAGAGEGDAPLVNCLMTI